MGELIVIALGIWFLWKILWDTPEKQDETRTSLSNKLRELANRVKPEKEG